jgi:hypothetical protein
MIFTIKSACFRSWDSGRSLRHWELKSSSVSAGLKGSHFRRFGWSQDDGRTQGPTANRLDVDPVHNEIFVADGDRIRVYPRESNGDIPPIRIIEGRDTQLKKANSIAVDPVNNVFVVGLNKHEGDADGALLIFNRTDSGNAKPKVIRGPKSEIIRINALRVYPPRKLIVAAMPGIQDQMEPEHSFLGVWSYDDNGDIPSRWKIPIGLVTTLKKVFGAALNPKNKEVIISDMRLNGVLTFSVPEIF